MILCYNILFKNIPLNLNQNHLFNYYSKKNIKTLKLDVIKKEFVKTPHSNQQCFLVVPHAVNNEYLLKNKGENENLHILLTAYRYLLKYNRK